MDYTEVTRKELRDYLTLATRGIFLAWDESRKTFFRTTKEKDSRVADGRPFNPTVTMRCVEVLLQIELTHDVRADFPKVFSFESVGTRLLELKHEALKSTIGPSPTSKKSTNVFTLSLSVLTLSLLVQRLKTSVDSIDTSNRLQPLLSGLQRKLVRHLQRYKGALLTKAQPHPFLSFHALRALKTYCKIFPDYTDDYHNVLEDVLEQGEVEVHRLIALHSVSRASPSDTVALIFCGALFSLSDNKRYVDYVPTILELAFQMQHAVGGWPLGRLVKVNEHNEARPVEISSFEIGWVLGRCIYECAYSWQTLPVAKTDSYLASLNRVFDLATASAIHTTSKNGMPLVGWCNNKLYREEVIESWTTATVVQFLSEMDRLLRETSRRRTLSRYVHMFPSNVDWPEWLRWKKLKRNAEVDHKYPIYKYIEDRIVRSILDSHEKMPSARKENVSFVLFGPPGTSKTILAQAVADALDWPILILTPGTFIKKGLEAIESIAGEVFEDLLSLERCVVFFDECDELFRRRVPIVDAEQPRGITAFITASMLPKLQALHDRGRVVFIVATNHLESLDDAVMRGGRIDHIIGVSPPDAKARRKIIIESLREIGGDLKPSLREHLVTKLTKASQNYSRSELRRATKMIVERAGSTTLKTDLDDTIKNVAQQMEASIVITKDTAKKFNELVQKHSAPVITKLAVIR